MANQWYCPVGPEQRALSCLAEAWHLAQHLPDAWLGWDLRQTALALYMRDGHFFLAGHPRPPAPAREVFWPVGCDGPTVYRLSGLPREVAGGAQVISYAGVPTAFIPLEVAGQGLEEAIQFVLLIWQEGFRPHLQARARALEAAATVHYPSDLPVNNALGNIEGQLLLEVFHETAAARVRQLGLAFALIRRERRGLLEDAWVGLEQAQEFRNGLASYVAFRALTLAADPDYEPCPAFRRVVGDEYTAAAADLRARRLASLESLHRRGQGLARHRFVHSGMGLALLLDQVQPGWKGRLGVGVTLDVLLEEQLTFDGGAGDDSIIAETEFRYDYVKRLEAEREHTRYVQRRKQELVENVLQGQGTLFIFDVSGLEPTFTKWDLEKVEEVNERLKVHNGAAIFQFGHTTLSFSGLPVVEDRISGLLEVCIPHDRLKMTGDASTFALLKPAEFTEGFELKVGGVRVSAQQGIIKPVEGAIYVKIRR